MDNNKLEAIKAEGIRKAIFTALRDKIFDAQTAMACSANDGFKEFGKHIKKAKDLVGDAEALFLELKKVQ